MEFWKKNCVCNRDMVPRSLEDLHDLLNLFVKPGKCSEEIKKFCDLKSEIAVDCISKKLKSEDGKHDV